MPALLVAAAIAASTLSPPQGYTVVSRIDLQAPLGLPQPWTATVVAPSGPEAATGTDHVRVCFTGPARSKAACQPVAHDGYRYQTFVDARVETLSQATGQRALVVRASYSGGSHSVTRTIVFSFTGEGFLPIFASDLGDTGDQERFASGPLDGYFIAADFAFTRADETWWDPHRYSVRVNRVQPNGGYLQVLQYLTSKTYPAERETPNQVIAGELSTVRRLLRAVYPDGPPP